MSEIVEQRWKKLCNGPDGPLVPPDSGQPGRGVQISILDSAEVIVDCNNFRKGRCAISRDTSKDCVFSTVLNETPRMRQEYAYRAIKARPGISQGELTGLLGVSQPTISREVSQLIGSGIVSASESRRNKPGHPTTLFHILPEKSGILD